MRVVQANIFLYFFLLILGISGFFFAVTWPQIEGFYAFIAFAAAGGLGVALYIYHTKKNHRDLVCPVGSDCNAVVNSRYSHFLGISVEYYGMVYYSLILIFYVALIFMPQSIPDVLRSAIIMISGAAFLFSLYLLFVQAFILRQWCIWCLLSALLSIIIFIISLGSVNFAVVFLGEMRMFIEAVHALGFALGIGAASSVVFLFGRFLRDFNIDDTEMQTLKWISELVWLGLGLILISQFAYFVAHSEVLAFSSTFLVQTIAIFVAVITGAVLMIVFAPILAVIPFGEKSEQKESKRFSLLRLKRPLFVWGGIALSSWYFAFIMDYIPPEIPFVTLFISYLIVLLLAAIVALIWESSVKFVPE